MRKRTLFVFLLVLGIALVACTAEPEVVEVTRVVTETETVVQEGETVEVEVTRVITEEVAVETEVTRVVTEEVVVEATPVPVDRKGGWLDTIAFIVEPNQDAVVARIDAGDLHLYGDDIGSQSAVQAIRDSENMHAFTQYGLYDEIMMNTGTCYDETLLNPFQSAKVREAMNWAVDRDYVADELYNGLAVPKYTAIAEAGADRGRYAAEIRSIEAKYAYDFDKANEVITAEMEAMGAEMVDGLWNFAGEPVTLIGLIRIEDTRLEIGNYVANQLEEMGFTIERIERVSSELSPLWVSSDPLECQWNFYTGAWSQTAIARTSGGAFEQFYTPRLFGVPSFLIYEPPPDVDEPSLRIFNNDFADYDERAELFRRFLPAAAEYSPRIWVTSRTTLVPVRNEISVSSDLAAGIAGSALWSRTVRFADQVGGSLNAGVSDIYVEPYNPIGGSNWVWDGMLQNAVSEPAVYTDPNTGLGIPNRIESGSLVVEEGFPIAQTTGWVDVTFSPEIVVPDDAWADWDAANQVFLTAGEVYTETQTARVLSTVTYPADLWDTIVWHDGSPMSPADFIMNMIMAFDQGKEESPYYDEAFVPQLQQFQSSFKGLRILSMDPLTIEHYSDNPALDAENSLTTWWPYSTYSFGDAAWHNMAVMLRAEGNQTLAFSDEKANQLEVERLNMVGGPSLEILGAELEGATAENFIPFEPTLGQYITADEAAARYANLSEFVRRYGHYYIGTGPYFMQGVFPIEGQAILKHWDNHPDPADRYSGFAAPALAEVEIDGESRVTIGQEAAFDIFIDVFGGPYAVDDIDSVSYLLFDATGAQVGAGPAEAVEDGLWQVVLDADTTGALAEGSNRLEIVVVSKLVALPSLGQFEFVTAP